VVFTGDWVLPVREAEASSSLADQGIDVLTGHTGSPRVIVQMAERRGIFANGYQFNQSSMAPRGFLTGAEWHWSTVYCRYAEMLREGKSVSDGSIPRRLTGTLKDAFCALSPFGPQVTERTRQAQMLSEALSRSTSVKDEMLAELDRVHSRQRDAVSQVQASEDQLVRADVYATNNPTRQNNDTMYASGTVA